MNVKQSIPNPRQYEVKVLRVCCGAACYSVVCDARLVVVHVSVQLDYMSCLMTSLVWCSSKLFHQVIHYLYSALCLQV